MAKIDMSGFAKHCEERSGSIVSSSEPWCVRTQNRKGWLRPKAVPTILPVLRFLTAYARNRACTPFDWSRPDPSPTCSSILPQPCSVSARNIEHITRCAQTQTRARATRASRLPCFNRRSKVRRAGSKDRPLVQSYGLMRHSTSSISLSSFLDVVVSRRRISRKGHQTGSAPLQCAGTR